MNGVVRQSWIAVRLIVIGALVLGVLYPLLVTGLGALISASSAQGSLLERNGEVIGSALIGQNFEGDQWFQPRPSAAGADGYDAMSSGGSNLGPNSEDLVTAVEQRRAAVQSQDGVNATVPPDALTASGSGLDPHISPEYAQLQVPRVSKANGLSESVVAGLVKANTEGRQFGFLGEDRVNVLLLNLAISNARR